MARHRLAKAKKITLPRALKRLFPHVRHAHDATDPVEVSVEARDCKNAQKLQPAECALARAARRELKMDQVIIGMTSSYLIKGDTAIRFATPESVRREIVSFDRHGDFAPGDYHLVPQRPSQRFGVERPRSENKTGGKYKYAKRKFHTSARVRVLPGGASSE